MKVLDGNVNVYDLSSGKTLPYWLKTCKLKELLKKNPELKNRKIDIIQDFYMPDISTRVLETNDGQYILSAGLYSPRIKCFDTEAHSIKFERGVDNHVLDMLSLDDDYSKLVLLQEDRWLELHSRGGRSFIERLPRLGTRLDYHYPDCDLYISTTGPEIDRFNLDEGRMKTPLITREGANNVLTIHPDHYKMLATGSVDGTIEIWDPQNSQKASGHLTIDQNDIPLDFAPNTKFEVTSLCFNKLTLAVGTRTGQVLLYDLRTRKPYRVADQSKEKIKSIKFHSSGNIMSMSTGYLKIWNHHTGDVVTSITSDVELNDLCTIDNTGMVFMAADQPHIKSYFIPALGEAPKWCSHLDALVEELREEDPTEYEDFIFVTEQELKDLHMTNMRDGITAHMHGFKVPAGIYHKMKQMTNQILREELVERKVKDKISENYKMKLPVATEKPKVNGEIHQMYSVLADTGSRVAQNLLTDTRFKDFFYGDIEYTADQEDADWSLHCFQKNKHK